MSSKLLNTPWTFFYDHQQRYRATQENWNEIIKQVCTIDNIPSFLFVIEELQDADMWPFNSNVHVFREGIQPAWEDPANEKGGKWVVELKKKEDTDELNKAWKNTMAFCVAEYFDSEIICGCVFSPRKHVDRIAIWVNTTDEDKVKEVGRTWKKECEFDDQISFKVHENALKGIRDRNMDLYKL